MYACALAQSLQSCPTLCDPMDCAAHQAPLSMGFFRQEYWSGLPYPGNVWDVLIFFFEIFCNFFSRIFLLPSGTNHKGQFGFFFKRLRRSN